MKKDAASFDDEIIFDDLGELSELDFGGNREENPADEQLDKEKYIEENIWYKLEKAGKKISFARDVMALYRYMKDSFVSWQRKAIVVAALIYFISPVDTIPDLTPFFGYLDDLGVITALLKYLGSELVPYYDPRYRT